MQQTNCNFIKEWFFAASTDTTGTPLTSGTVFDRLQTSSTTGDINANSETIPDLSLTFKVYVKTGPDFTLNLNPVTVTLNIKCSEETLNDFYNAVAGL